MAVKLNKSTGAALLLGGFAFAGQLEENIALSNKYIAHAAEVVPLFNYQTKKAFSYPVKAVCRYSAKEQAAGDTIVEIFYPDLFIKSYVFKDSAVGFYAAGLDFQTNMHGKKEEFASLIPSGSIEAHSTIDAERDGAFFKSADAKIPKLLKQCDEPDSANGDIRLMGWETGSVGYVYYIHTKEPDQIGEIIYRKSDASSIHCSFQKSANENEYKQILKKGIRLKGSKK